MTSQPLPTIFPQDPRLEQMLSRRKLMKLVWHLTNRCNLACTYCYVKVNRFRSDLPTEQMLSISDQINASGAGSVQLTGGEALLRQDLLTVLDRLSRTISISVNTNGALLTSEMIDALSERKVFVSISLDHYDHALNVRTRKGSPTVELIAHLRRLADAGITTGVSTVVTRYNHHDLGGIAEVLRQSGVSTWKAITVSSIGEAADPGVYGELTISPAEQGRALQTIYDLRQSYASTGFEVKAGVSPHPAFYELFGGEDNQSTSCLCGYVKATIKHDGRMVPCDSIEYPGDYLRAGIRAPSLLTDGTIRDIFRESRLFHYWSMATAGVVPLGCNNCEFFQRCRGFCRGRSLVAAGKVSGLFGPAQDCARNLLLHAESSPTPPGEVTPTCSATPTAAQLARSAAPPGSTWAARSSAFIPARGRTSA